MVKNHAVEFWTEINILPITENDESLLIEDIYPIVSNELKAKIETWFFFWEPELRVRVRWKSAAEKSSGDKELFTRLDALVAKKRAQEWYEGNHGARGGKYHGEAKECGEEYWQGIQKDWMYASEFAVRLAKEKTPTDRVHTKEFQWERRVHLFSNQLFATEAKEIEMCLKQARGRMKFLSLGVPNGVERTAAHFAAIDSVLADLKSLETLEIEVIKRWRAAGCPDWLDFLKLKG